MAFLAFFAIFFYFGRICSENISNSVISISSTPNSLIDDVIVSLVNMLPRIGDSTSQVAETVWLALKMSVRKFQHSKVIRVLLKSNPGTNPSLKEVNIPSMRRRIMFLLESILTLWEDARPLRKQKAGKGLSQHKYHTAKFCAI